MKPANPRILTINGGSSSIKFALFQVGEPLERGLSGKVDRIGLRGTNLTFHDPASNQQDSRSLAVNDHKSAANFLIDWLVEQDGFSSLVALGHRVVHGMKHIQPEIITQDLLDELHCIIPYDPDHMPREIELMEAFCQRHPKLPQVACFDTAFHRTMPRVARRLPIPRRYEAKGVQRYGFHGLSYAYLMEELARLGDPAATVGRVILARICEEMSFLGIELNESRNAETAGVISTDASRATVRVIRTDEELMIARSVCRALGLGMASEKMSASTLESPRIPGR
jgi:acetate kinase